MEEFIENFNEFRDWLNDFPAKTAEDNALLTKIRDKFEELGLNNVF